MKILKLYSPFTEQTYEYDVDGVELMRNEVPYLRYYAVGTEYDPPSTVLPQVTDTGDNHNLVMESLAQETTLDDSGVEVPILEAIHRQNGNNTLWGLLRSLEEDQHVDRAIDWFKSHKIEIITK